MLTVPRLEHLGVYDEAEAKDRSQRRGGTLRQIFLSSVSFSSPTHPHRLTDGKSILGIRNQI